MERERVPRALASTLGVPALEEDPYLDLRAEVARRALRELDRAETRLAAAPGDPETMEMARAATDYLLSEQFAALTGLDGEELIGIWRRKKRRGEW